MKKFTVINAKSSQLSVATFRELWAAREMLVLWIWRDIKVRYSQSALGVAWSMFPMLSQVLIYTVVFGKLVRIDSDGAPYALFALTGVVPWLFFSQGLNAVSSSVYGAGSFLQKIYFPRLILPIAALFDKFFDFLISFSLLLTLLAFSGASFNLNVLFLPFLVLIIMIAVLGFGMLAAAMAVHFRDILHIMGYVTMALMYASPVVYPVSLVPAEYRFFYGLNPMVGVIEGFRSALLSTRVMPWDLITMSAVVACSSLLLGVIYFKLAEVKFADVG
jgi:lipopolysaccharide transport system permease protein